MKSHDAKMRTHGTDRDGRRPRPRISPTLAAAILGLALTAGCSVAQASADKYASPANSALPPSDMQLDLKHAALVVSDPQIDFLSPKGVTWGVVGESVTELGTVANLDRLFVASKKAGIVVAISPHYYYPTDKGWKFEGALEKLMHKIGMFDGPAPTPRWASRTPARTSCPSTSPTSSTARP